MKTRIVALSIVCIMAAILSLLRMYDRRYLSSEESVRELMYFPRAEAVRAVSAGNELLVADYLWLRMIQYYAYHMRRDRNYEYLYPIIDKLTDLDPKFVYPYTFGALLLVHDARDSINSLRLLEKGRALNPQEWRFPYMKGFILYVFLRRWEEAAREFLSSAELPGAIPGAKRFAAFIYRRLGQREVSRAMWQEIYDTSPNPFERQVAKFYLDRIEVEETIERLQKAAEMFFKKYGRWPQRLEDLRDSALLERLPAQDPLGGRYYWSVEEHKVKSSGRSSP